MAYFLNLSLSPPIQNFFFFFFVELGSFFYKKSKWFLFFVCLFVCASVCGLAGFGLVKDVSSVRLLLRLFRLFSSSSCLRIFACNVDTVPLYLMNKTFVT